MSEFPVLLRRTAERVADYRKTAIEGVETRTTWCSTRSSSASAPTTTDRVIAAVQRDGTCWMGGTEWRGRRFMRISVSNWSTTQADVDRSVAAIRVLAQGA